MDQTIASKSEFVAARIREYILENRLKPGDKLPTEGQLVELYGVSRVTVREATKALSFLGIVDAAPRRGLTVGNISMKRLSQYLGFHFAVSDYPLDELIDTRIVIEAGGLSHVAKRMKLDPTIYEKLNAINDRLRRGSRLAQCIEHDILFHCTLVDSSGLNALGAFNDLVQVFFQRIRANLSKAEWSLVADAHQKIIDALKQGDSELAARSLSSHVESHRKSARDS